MYVLYEEKNAGGGCNLCLVVLCCIYFQHNVGKCFHNDENMIFIKENTKYTHFEVVLGIAGHGFSRNFDISIEQNQRLSNAKSRIL